MSDRRALILDYGGVLSHPQPEEWFSSTAREMAVEEGALRRAYWQHRHAYDAGLPAEEYWQRVEDTLGLPSRPHLIPRLIQSDVESWTSYREEVWAVARSFRARGGRTAFLSNGVPEAMARIRAERPLERWFDVVVVSFEVGVAKPDPDIYRICLSRLGVLPEQALFVDDRADNIEAAARLGIETLHFEGDQALGKLRALIMP